MFCHQNVGKILENSLNASKNNKSVKLSWGFKIAVQKKKKNYPAFCVLYYQRQAYNQAVS